MNFGRTTPLKIAIALCLLREFKKNHEKIKITAILADALYGEAYFMTEAAQIFENIQVISQLRENQNIEYKGEKGILSIMLITQPRCARHNPSS